MAADKKSNPAQISQAVLDETNQSIKVSVVSGGSSGVTSDTNLKEVGGNTVATGAGAADTGTQRVVIATDQATLPVDIQDTEIAVSLDKDEDSVTVYSDPLSPLDVAGAVTPEMTSGGHLAVTTSTTGSTFVAFASQQCRQLTISNQSGTTIEVRQGGAGVAFQIPTAAFYTFFGLINANELDLRRTDVGNTQVTITARWEA